MSDYFQIEKAAKTAGMTDTDLQRLAEMMRREFPDDSMMQELHVLRACMTIAEGRLTLAEALHSQAGAAA